MFERAPAESEQVLTKYLERSRVASGKALETARTEYRNQNRRATSRDALPSAWNELVSSGDEILVQLLVEAVEQKVGFQPEAEDVVEFLMRLGANSVPQQIAVPTPRQTRTVMPTVAQQGQSVRAGTVIYLGRHIPYPNAKEAMLLVFRNLAEQDPTFLERCSNHPHAQGNTRRYIARTPEQLYPDREDLRTYYENLPGGWVIGTNLNNVLKKRLIKMAAEVAGLRFGNDIKVDF